MPDEERNTAEMLLYGEISEYSWYGDEITPSVFNQELKDLGAVDEITVRINSGGGDVFAAVAIYTRLKEHEITLPGFEDLAKKAKYEEPVSAEAFAMQIVAAQKKTGQAFLNDREDDVDKSGVKDVTPTSNNGGQGEDNDPFGDIIDQMYPQTK